MNNTEIRQEIIESLTYLSDEQLWTIKELINQNFIPKVIISSKEERKQLINSLQGKYSHASSSSEDFARQKQAEIDWENRCR